MAVYNKDDVNYSGIRQLQLTTGGKIGTGKYTIDENGNIIENQPIINAIDIDWNNASTEGIGPISKTSDLINLLKNIKGSIPDNIYDLSGANNLLTIQDLQVLKPQLTGKSAYELAKESYEETTHQVFPYSTVESWIASLKGEQGQRGFPGADGKDGKSAYDIAREYYQSIDQEFPYQNESDWIEEIISGNDSKDYTDLKLSQLRTELNNTIQNSISDTIDNLVDGASSAFDTFKEVEKWIEDLPMTPQQIQSSLIEVNNLITELTGELKEEKAIDDGFGNITYITDYKTYDKTGEQYGKSLEEINEKINNLLNTVSIAKDVQDGAQENLIEYITHKDQTFNINNENILNHFIVTEKPENSKTVLLGINLDLLNNIGNDIISKSVLQSKEYIDKKLSWKVN